jgi:hypothetical protein
MPLHGRPIDAAAFGLHGRFVGYPAPGEQSLSSWPWIAHGSIRVWNAYTAWYDVNPAPGTFNFGRLDAIVNEATTRGARVLLTLGRTPTWASARPDEASGAVPGSAAEPANVCDWIAYVDALATRYAGRVEGFEVWNEPAFADFENPYRDDGSAKQYFSGTAAAMVQLTAHARAVVKAADPAALIVGPGITCEANGVGRLAAFLDAGGGELCDVLGYHFYLPYPEDAVREALAVQATMRARGLSLPLWDTEAGYVLDEANATPIDKVDRQGWAEPLSPHNAGIFLARSFLLQFAFGVERLYWYTWDHDIAPDPMGLAGSGQALNDQGTAYAKVQGWLKGATLTRWDWTPSGRWTISARRGPQAFAVTWRERGTETLATTPRTTAEPLFGPAWLTQGAAIAIGQEPVLLVDR